jgi:hypothetical protein
MKYKKLLTFYAYSAIVFFCESLQAAENNDIWDGLYLRTDSGRNIEFKHNHVRTDWRYLSKENTREHVYCLIFNPEDDHNLVKATSAKEIKSIIFKPSTKWAAQMYEINEMEVYKKYEETPTKRFCYDERNDILPKSRSTSDATEFQVSPRMKPGKYYVIDKDNNTRHALIKFIK